MLCNCRETDHHSIIFIFALFQNVFMLQANAVVHSMSNSLGMRVREVGSLKVV